MKRKTEQSQTYRFLWPVCVVSLQRLAATVGIGFAFLLPGTFSAAVNGQVPLDDEPAPPPLRLISKGEMAQLNTLSDPRRRIDTALQLMGSRIAKAEELRKAESFDEMFVELGGFHGLMDNTLQFLTGQLRQTGKPVNYSKKYEIGLRAFAPRIALIRRDLPGRYDHYVSRLLSYLREARSKTIEPFFGDDVVPNVRQ